MSVSSASVARTTVSTLATRLVIVASGLLSTLISARYLGPEGRGQYFAAVTLAATLGQFANLGLNSSNTLFAARETQAAGALVTNSVWIALASLLLSVVFVASGLASRVLGEVLTEPLLWAACVVVPAALLFMLVGSVMAGLQRFSEYNRWQLANSLLAVLAVLAAALFDLGLLAMLVAVALAGWIACYGILRKARFDAPLQVRFDVALFGRSFGYAWRAYFALILSFLMQRTGVWLLAMRGDSEGLGYLSIASQIHDVLLLLPTTLAFVLFPSLVRGATSHRDLLRLLVRSTLLMLGGCTGVALLIRPLLGILFGAEFVPAAPVVIALLPAAILTGAAAILSQYVVAERFPIALICVWAAGLGVALATGAALTSGFGPSGAAFGQSIGAAVVLAGAALLARARHSAMRDNAAARRPA